MNNKHTFFTSDWHLGHDAIMKYCNEPFNSREERNEALIKRFNATVGKDHLTYFLGDMGNLRDIREVLPRLNGTKVLIMGNHDKKTNSMYNCGFDVVLQNGVIELANEYVTLSHYPFVGVYRQDVTGMRNAVNGENWHGEIRFFNRGLFDTGYYHLHGHTHLMDDTVRIGRQWDVGIHGNDFIPVSDKRVIKWIQESKNA